MKLKHLIIIGRRKHSQAQDCPHFRVVEATFVPACAEEIRATWRLCLGCGQSELRHRLVERKNGQSLIVLGYQILVGRAEQISFERFERQAWLLERKLGGAIQYGTL